MMLRECLIAGAAPKPDEDAFYRRLLSGYRLVIAADAAGEWCVGHGRVPDLVVGDFDSSAEGAASRLKDAGAQVVELASAKDMSDLCACLDAARGMGVGQVDFCAAFERRIDHTLAAVGTVLDAAAFGARIVEPGWTAWALDGATMPSVRLALAPGAVFSLLSPGGAADVTITGARFPLEHAPVPPLSSLGVSNVAVGDGPVSVSVGSGALLLVVQA